MRGTAILALALMAVPACNESAGAADARCGYC